MGWIRNYLEVVVIGVYALFVTASLATSNYFSVIAYAALMAALVMKVVTNWHVDQTAQEIRKATEKLRDKYVNPVVREAEKAELHQRSESSGSHTPPDHDRHDARGGE